jgi:biopolymer transport protein ExbD
MSHGVGDAATRVDPDLTAMLDVVMQLLMYFIMCVNFVGQEVPEEVMLPNSQGARPIDKSEGDILFLNITPDGKVVVFGQEPMDMQVAAGWLNNRVQEAPKDAKGNPSSAVVIRADLRNDYGNVYELMQLCKQKKFSKFKLRANMVGAGG